MSQGIIGHVMFSVRRFFSLLAKIRPVGSQLAGNLEIRAPGQFNLHEWCRLQLDDVTIWSIKSESINNLDYLAPQTLLLVASMGFLHGKAQLQSSCWVSSHVAVFPRGRFPRGRFPTWPFNYQFFQCDNTNISQEFLFLIIDDWSNV
jgi:hypothetical protein